MSFVFMTSDTNEGSSMSPSLPSPLARSFLTLPQKTIGIPKKVKVTQWGSPLETAKHVVVYFGGMPASAEEPAAHSKPGEDIYKARNIHLVCIDKPGFGGSSLNYRFNLRRDWPEVVSMVADQLKIEQKYGVVGMSNGGPYVMSCLTHPVLKNRVKAGSMVVGVSDVVASGYFSWKNPSCFMEGLYNSLPVYLTGPLNSLGLGLGSLFLFRFGGFSSTFGFLPDQAKEPIKKLLSDSCANFGVGSAIDCQQGLSPLYARSSKDNSAESIDRDARAAYADINVPVSLWYGEKDGSVPMASAEWLESIVPNAKLHKADCGHDLYFHHSERVMDDLVARMDEVEATEASEANK